MGRSNSAILKYDKWIKTLTCVFRLHNYPRSVSPLFRKKCRETVVCQILLGRFQPPLPPFLPLPLPPPLPPFLPPFLPRAGLDLPASVKCWRTAPPNPPSSSPRVCHIHPSCWNLRENSFWLPQWTQQLTWSVWNIDYSWMEGQLMDDG